MSTVSNKEALAALKRQQTKRENTKPKTVVKDKSGWMVKVSKKNQDRMYFEFNSDAKELRFFKNQNDSKRKGCIDMTSVRCIRPIILEKMPLSNAFSLRTIDKVHFFIAEDEREMKLWIKKMAHLEIPLMERCMDFEEEEEADEERKSLKKELKSQTRRRESSPRFSPKPGPKSPRAGNTLSALSASASTPQMTPRGNEVVYIDKGTRNEVDVQKISEIGQELENILPQIIEKVNYYRSELLGSLGKQPTDLLLRHIQNLTRQFASMVKLLQPYLFRKSTSTIDLRTDPTRASETERKKTLEILVTGSAVTIDNASKTLVNLKTSLPSLVSTKSLDFMTDLNQVVQLVFNICNTIPQVQESSISTSSCRGKFSDECYHPSARREVEVIRQLCERIFFKVAEFRRTVLVVLSANNEQDLQRMQTIHTSLLEMLKALDPYMDTRAKATIKMIANPPQLADKKKAVDSLAALCAMAMNHIGPSLINLKASAYSAVSPQHISELRQQCEKITTEILHMKVLTYSSVFPGEQVEIITSVTEDQEETEQEAPDVFDEQINGVLQSRFSGDNDVMFTHYEICLPIGSGATSVVHEARHRSTGISRAIKIVNVRKDARLRERIKKEALLLATLSHPNLPVLRDLFVDVGNINTATEYRLVIDFAAGGELTDKLIDLSKFREADAKRFVRQLTAAIQYLHQQEIVHGDIRPGNILLTSKTLAEANVLLCDLGNAIIVSGSETSAPAPTFLYGSLLYAAPECFDPSKNSWPRKGADVWALGCLIYTMLSGMPPFWADDDDLLQKKISKGQHFGFPNPDWTSISKEAKELIEKMLLIDITKRVSIGDVDNSTWLK